MFSSRESSERESRCARWKLSALSTPPVHKLFDQNGGSFIGEKFLELYQHLKLRVSNPRTVANCHSETPFESSNLPGAGPIFPDWAFDNCVHPEENGRTWIRYDVMVVLYHTRIIHLLITSTCFKLYLADKIQSLLANNLLDWLWFHGRARSSALPYIILYYI